MSTRNSITAKNINSSKYFLITIDVEDWFQVENFKPWIPFSTWDTRELRVEQNVHRLLDLLDSVKLPSEKLNPKNAIDAASVTRPDNSINVPKAKNATSENNTKNATSRRVHATFFVLCWIAEKLPYLVREIYSRGHEVASHGCNHELTTKISREELNQDLNRSKKKLEDITGSPVFGFRAPSFSINDGILKTIQENDYLYDSSYNSFRLHSRYGNISLNGSGGKGIAHKISKNFYELPISNLSLSALGALAHFNHLRQLYLPWGGGSYLRLIPFPIFKIGVKSIFRKDNAYLSYIHPWEIDHEQPRLNEVSISSKFRQYTNLTKTYPRLKNLIESHKHCRFITCRQYLDEII